jgi:hypothetical protein
MTSSANFAADRRDRLAGRWRWLLAALLALALHALAFGFRAVESGKVADGDSGIRRIHMLELAHPGPAQVALRHWFRWRNPLHFAKPTRLVFAAPPPRPEIASPGFVADRVPAVLHPGDFVPLPGDATVSAARGGSAMWIPVAVPAVPAQPTPAPASEFFPQWLHDGRVLAQCFADPAAMRKRAAAGVVVLPTTLEVRFGDPQLFPRIRIQASCGDASLDQAALQALLQSVGRVGEACGHDGGPCYIAIFWRPTPSAAEEPGEP